MSFMKGAGVTVAVILLVVGAAFGLRGLGLIEFQVFGPKEEATRREVFEESKAYRDGMAQELRNMQFEYVKADPEHKAALRSIVLHRVAGFPRDALPQDLAAWLNDLDRGVVVP